jgi:hypothetical protein
MPQNTYFDLPNQIVVSAYLLLLHQPQLPQLLKMVKRDAGAAKMQGTLDFSDSDWASRFQEEPVDFPGFAA